jgi:hypothetical protein
LGLNSPERERQLGEKLDKLAYEDFAIAKSAEKMLDCVDGALKDVQSALGDGGAMYTSNVPAAAALLAQYCPTFENMDDLATDGVRQIRSVIQTLK